VGKIRFEHDAANDVHIAYPVWRIESERDCKEWSRQYEAYFERFGRKVDVVFVLDEFHIGPGIGPVWGKYRSELVNRFIRFSVRVHSDGKVSTYAATSFALHGGSVDSAPDVRSATSIILELRRDSGS
jgi:hypothetical protein